MSELEDLQRLHKPVLVSEVLHAFGLSDSFALLQKRIKIIDATLGLGGHTEEFVKRGAQVLGVDEDSEMLELAERRLKIACPTPEKKFRGSYTLVKGSFKDILEIARKNNFTNADGILFDLGISSPQLTSDTRGFSFQNDSASLDMRLDREQMGIIGADMLNILREDQLTNMFEKVLNPKLSRDLARRVISFRKVKSFETVGDYKNVIRRVLVRKGRKSTETLPFLALRIAVNSELTSIYEGLKGAVDVLDNFGRIVVVSFHSGEDKLVKKMFTDFEKDSLGRVLVKKPIVPSLNEIEGNFRARSALLRIFEKQKNK